MRQYKVFIRGANFLLDLDGVQQKLGFYTTRFLEAADEEAAESVAVEILRHDPKLRGTLNARDDTPMIFVEEIIEVESSDGFAVPGAGFRFFPDEDEDEDE